MIRNSERGREKREREIVDFKPRGVYKEPGRGTAQFLAMDSRGREISLAKGMLDQENAKMEYEIRRAKEKGIWNWKTGGILCNAIWEGTPENGHVVSTLPKKIPPMDELVTPLEEAEAKMAQLEAKRKNPDKSKKKPKSKKATYEEQGEL